MASTRGHVPKPMLTSSGEDTSVSAMAEQSPIRNVAGRALHFPCPFKGLFETLWSSTELSAV